MSFSQRWTVHIFFLGITLALLGCSESEFKAGGNPKAPATEEPVAEANSTADAVGDDANEPPPPEPDPIPVFEDAPLGALGGTEANEVTETFVAEAIKQKIGSAAVDIMFVVDTSGSMYQERARLEENMQKFLVDLGTNYAIDYRIFLMADLFNAGNVDPSRFFHIRQRVGSTDALWQIMRFYETGAKTGLAMRKEAPTEIIVITDDDARGIPTATRQSFIQFIKANSETIGPVRINGFVIRPESVENNWCTRASIGNEYLWLEQNGGEYAGKMYDLCTEDWGDLVKQLAEDIYANVAKFTYKLNETNIVPSSIRVDVNGKPADNVFWSYDPTRQCIVFLPEKAPAKGDQIEVTYLVNESGEANESSENSEPTP